MVTRNYFQARAFSGTIFDVNVYDSVMKEKELRTKFSGHRDNCLCDRGELFWIDEATDAVER